MKIFLVQNQIEHSDMENDYQENPWIEWFDADCVVQSDNKGNHGGVLISNSSFIYIDK